MSANRSRAGRPARPKAAKVLEGTFRPDREAPGAFDPPHGVPDCPEWLPALAREEWERLVADPEIRLVLARVDQNALAAWADAVATWRVASAVIEAEGTTYEVEGKAGTYMKLRPEVALRDKARMDAVNLGREFGLTPASRSKVLKATKPEEEDPLEALKRAREQREKRGA